MNTGRYEDHPEMQALVDSFEEADEIEEIDTSEIAAVLMTTLCEQQDPLNDPGDVRRVEAFLEAISGITTYEEAGMMTHDSGLVLTMVDGSEYRMTITKARR